MLPYVLRSRCVLPLIALALTAGTVRAATFTASADGNWNDGATWGNTSPGVEGVCWSHILWRACASMCNWWPSPISV